MSDINDNNRTVDLNQTPPPPVQRRKHYFPDRAEAPQEKPQDGFEEGFDEDFEEYDEGKGSNAPMIAAVIAAVVIVLAAAGFFAYIFFLSPNSNNTIPSTAATTEAPTENVSTQPLTETPVARLVKMPDLSGLSEEAAYQKLNESGVKYKVTRQYSDTVLRGYVITQKPEADSELLRTDEAMVYLSKGKEDDIVPFTTAPKSQKSTKSTESTEPTKGSGSGSYILPDSDSKYLSKSDLRGFDRSKLNLALNEIFARHGRIFSDSEIKSYFNAQSWYHGTVNPEDFSMSVLNEYELYNLDLIASYQSELGYR